MFTLQSKGRILPINAPLVMGILNTTPDSFYPGSRVDASHVLDRAGSMIEEGAAILDIGGQSTRPGAKTVAPDEEAQRVLPAIELVRTHFPDIWISVHTYYASVARQAISAGADMVNDISAGEADVEMLRLIAGTGVPYIAMHKKAEPETMQDNPQYADVLAEVMDYFVARNKHFSDLGIHDWLLDPGFGFGKSLEHNFQLFAALESFTIFKKPVVVGISRKGMIWKTLNSYPEKALNGTTAMHMAALLKKANILRVHDVAEASECIRLFQAFHKYS